MDLVHISSAVVWIDFVTIALSKIFNLGRTLDVWYSQFGIVAVISDCLVIVLGIMIAQLFFPTLPLIPTAIAIQIVHDILFYLFVIMPIPVGHNAMIDLFKSYSAENGWKILLADSIMIGSTVVLADYLKTLKSSHISFIGLLGVYALTYIIYTK